MPKEYTVAYARRLARGDKSASGPSGKTPRAAMSTRAMCVRLRPEEREWLEQIAALWDMSPSEAVARLAWDAIEREKLAR